MIPPGFRPLDIEPRAHRSALERAALRHPAIHRTGVRLMSQLPPGALRRLYLERLVLPLAYGALNRRDLTTLTRVYFTDDIRMRFTYRIPGFPSQFNGRDEVVQGYGEWMDQWGVLERTPAAYAERDDLLIVLTRQRGRGSASGIAIDDEIGQVYRVRDGLAAEYTEYRTWDEALAHAG